MMPFQARKGFALVMVLIIAAIGLLFGAGALLLFRYQCQMRIDRQHELEKNYAVRSALNYLRMETVTDPGSMFYYHTGSDRDLGVFIKPAKTFFPVTNGIGQATGKRHFVMEWGDLYIPPGKRGSMGGYNSDRDYEYGAEGVTNLCVAITNQVTQKIQNETRSTYGLVFNCNASSSDVASMRCWVNIGMRGTGGWLQDEYGRRYCFYLRDIQYTDCVRFWLIRDNLDAVNKSDGKSFGWPPLSGNPLMLKIAYNGKNRRMLELFECNGSAPSSDFLCQLDATGGDNVGVQFAHDKVSLFLISNKYTEDTRDNVLLRGFEFSNVATMSDSTYDYYYRGSEIDGEQKVVNAPDLRAVFEIVADAGLKDKNRIIQDFKVTPGYQYDVSVVYPAGITNLATVAQRSGEIKRGKALLYSLLTYDTHGTENRGFRKDERLWRETRKK